jgi:hypothetical protein
VVVMPGGAKTASAASGSAPAAAPAPVQAQVAVPGSQPMAVQPLPPAVNIR